MRLRTRKQYQRMARGSTKFFGRWIIIDANPSAIGHSRLGITVTKRFGKAHERNQFKRLVREAFRLSVGQISMLMDIIVKPRSAAINASFRDVQDELIKGFLEIQKKFCEKGEDP